MRRNLALILLSFILLSQVMIFVVDRESWFDVSFSLEVAHKLNSGEKIVWSQMDVHPPGYYYILAAWQKVNPGILSEYHWAQELSVIFGIIFIICSYSVLRLWFGKNGEFASFFLVLSTTYLHFFTEVRSYALLLAASAFLYYSFSKSFQGEWRRDILRTWSVIVAIVLPWLHYFGVFVMASLLLFSLITGRNRKFVFWLTCLTAVSALTVFSLIAVHQMARSENTWFLVSDLLSFGSALFYSVFLMDDMNNFVSSVSFVYYVGFLVAVILVLWNLQKLRKEDERTGIGLAAPIIFPFVALLILTIFSHTWRLYHHRLFLPVTWTFAAIFFVMMDRFFDRLRKPVDMVVRVAFICALGLFFIFYAQNAHHELKNIAYATPCNATIGHESPFSAIPYEVYARERGCQWDNFVSTNITVRMSHAAGFDLLNKSKVYWNLTLPEGSFYYVMSEAKSFNLENRTTKVVHSEDGVWLVEVSSR